MRLSVFFKGDAWSRLRWSTASLRAHLLAVTLLATVPMTLLAAWLISEQARESRAQLDADLARAVRAFAMTVDRELASSAEALQVLAMTDQLQQGDLAGVFTSLAALPSPRQSWGSVFLSELDGQIVFNTQQPAGRPLGRLSDPAALTRLRQTARPVVTNLTTGPDGRLATGVLVPVHVQGKLAYALGAWIPPSSWMSLIGTSGLPQSAFMSIFDGDLRLVARNRGGEAVVAQPLPALTRVRLNDGPSGTGRIGILEGGEAYGAWQRIDPGQWGVVIGEPAEPMDRAHRASVTTALLMGLASLAGGMLLAMGVASRVTGPLRALALHGPQRRGEPSTVRELQMLEQALQREEAQRDIAHERLQRQAAEFETLFRSSPIGLAMTQERDCGHVLRNPALTRMLGEDAEQTPDIAQAERSGWPDCPMYQQGMVVPADALPLQKAARTGWTQKDVELTIQAPDGAVRKVIAHAVPLFDGRGAPRGAIASFTDITARQQDEASLAAAEKGLRANQQLVELAQAAGHVGFFQHSRRHALVHWSTGFSRLLDLPLSELRGSARRCLRRVLPEDRNRVVQALRAAAAGRTNAHMLEFRHKGADGEVRWLGTRLRFTWDARGRPEQVSGVVVDITTQKAIEAARLALVARETAARQQAEEANRNKDEFLAMLGHELRNPLGAIAAGCEVLNRAGTQEDLAKRARQIIARQAAHLGRLMDDLLDVASVLAGQHEEDNTAIRLDLVADRVRHTLDLAGQLAQHTVKAHLQPVWVEADPSRMEQIFTNLLVNALKYTPPGGHITLTVGPGEGASRPEAVATVQDTGAGLSPALQSRVFDLFVQGERTLDRQQGGLGIGLTLVKRLVEHHGGQVAVHSDGPGQGATFTVRLPACEPPEPAVQALAEGPLPPLRVVIVEDNDDAGEALRSMLALDQHTVQVATNGPDGIALILSTQPDLALVDIGLPGLGGLEVAATLRARGHAGWLVAVSGYGRADDLKRSRAAGFDRHLVKPVTAARIERMLVMASRPRPAADQADNAEQDHGTDQ